MGREADIISELIEVHADNFSINKRVRDASRLLASPFATVLTVSSGEITVTPKTGEGGGLFYFKIATLGIVHTINGLTEGDIIGIGYDDALGSSAFVGEDGSGGNCLFGPVRLEDGEYLFVKCDKGGDLLLLPYEKEYDVQVLTGFQSSNAYTSDRRVFDMSGCTSYSVLQIQAPAGDGTYPEFIEIKVSEGNSTYEVRIQGSLCDIDGVSSGTVWGHLKNSGDNVVLMSNGDGTGWVVVKDSEKLVREYLYENGTLYNFNPGVGTIVDVPSWDIDIEVLRANNEVIIQLACIADYNTIYGCNNIIREGGISLTGLVSMRPGIVVDSISSSNAIQLSNVSIGTHTYKVSFQASGSVSPDVDLKFKVLTATIVYK